MTKVKIVIELEYQGDVEEKHLDALQAYYESECTIACRHDSALHNWNVDIEVVPDDT